MPSDFTKHFGWVLRTCLGAAILLAVFYAATCGLFGPSEAAWALLRGEAIAIVPATTDLGDCRAGEVKHLDLQVINVSSSAVTLTGMHTSCSCLLATMLPMVLEAGRSATLRLTVEASGAPGEFERQAVLYTDSSTSPQLPIVVVGRIRRVEPAADLPSAAQEARAVGERQFHEMAHGMRPLTRRGGNESYSEAAAIDKWSIASNG